MKKEGDRRYAAPPREPPVPVHPLHHPAEAVAVALAVAEPVDGDDAREDIKTGVLPSTVPKTMCGQCRRGMVLRRKRKRTTTRRRRPTKRPRRMTYSQVGGVSPGLPIGILKAGYGATKAIGEHQTKRAIKIADKRRRDVESGKRKRYAGESFNCSIM